MCSVGWFSMAFLRIWSLFDLTCLGLTLICKGLLYWFVWKNKNGSSFNKFCYSLSSFIQDNCNATLDHKSSKWTVTWKWFSHLWSFISSCRNGDFLRPYWSIYQWGFHNLISESNPLIIMSSHQENPITFSWDLSMEAEAISRFLRASSFSC